MKNIYKFLTFLITFLVLAHWATCAIIHVPADHLTIQAAIDASVDGDTVLVDPNTYYENLTLNGKNITICSKYCTTGNSWFITSTIIDGANFDRVITIDQGENSSCKIIGFTIQHGNAPAPPPGALFGGGGIFILDASPQILSCIIKNNYAPGFGGGIGIYGGLSSAVVSNCTIETNAADSSGGGVFMGDCAPGAAIINSTISGNTITCGCDFNSGGGGVSIYHTGKLENCLITNNSAPNALVGGGGVYCDWGDEASHSITITGCTIAMNTALNSGGVSYVINGGEFRNCIIWDNTDYFGNTANYDGNTFVNCCTDPMPAGADNIDTNPAFVNASSGNFRLTSASPCINSGNNAFNSQPYDLDKNPRIFNGTIDMGAYEKGAGTGLTVQIGSGTDVSEDFPINAYYNYSYTQQIYLGSEIVSGGGATGLISKIRFFYVGGGTQFSNWNNWNVYLGHTTRSVFTSSSDWVPADSLQQVFSGIIANPIPGTWVEITLPVPYYYSGNNLVVAVDENAEGWDDPVAQWGSFFSGTDRGLSFSSDVINPDPAAPPDATLGPASSIAQVQFQIQTSVGVLEGHIYMETSCTVPIEGAIITTGADSTISDASGHYKLILPAGAYPAVTAYYYDVSQTISTVNVIAGDTVIQNFCLPEYFPPPVSLKAQVQGTNLNDVHLTWKAPGSIADQWIYWGNGVLYGGLGYIEPTVFLIASRWPVDDIAPYGGTYLKKIRFAVGEPQHAIYTLMVWKGPNASVLLHSQAITNPYINTWNEVTLTSPVLIDGTQELWFGIDIQQTAGECYPAGLTQGPAVTGKGNMLNSGYGWTTIGWDFNWALQGFISESAALGPQHVIPMVYNLQPLPAPADPLSAPKQPQIMKFDHSITSQQTVNLPLTEPPSPVESATTHDAPMSTLTGYNVYRDNVKIADNIPGLSFDDTALPKGGYDYKVSAQYDNGESARKGPVHVGIYTCFPPTGLTVANATLTTTTAILSWTPSTRSTNPEWIVEWGNSGFQRGLGTTVHINTTPALSFTSLTPGEEYDCYVSTYCSSADTSAWVRKTFRTHYFDCPAGATSESEICGLSTNNGCDQVPFASGTISSGDTVCGTSWLSRSHRDSDWYSFTLTQTNDVTLTGTAEFSNIVVIRSDSCQSTFYYNSWYEAPGWPEQNTTRLSAGTYYVNVVPAYSEQVTCDSLSRYWITITCNPCLSPTELYVTNFNPTSADLGWTSSAAMWNIKWGYHGFNPNLGNIIPGTSSNPYHLSGLTMGRSYSFYVQSDCGGGALSNYEGPGNFFLPCPAATMPYAEDFSSQAIDSTPLCWQVHEDGSPSNWQVAESNFAGGTTSGELKFLPWNNYFSGRSYLTSPVINSTGMAEINLTFKHFLSSYNSATSSEVWTTSDGGITWNLAWSVAQAGNIGPETKSIAIINADVGSPTFQFAFAVAGNSYNIGYWNIDDISLTGIPQTGTLQGVITSCSSGSLLQGVAVSAGINMATTDASGFYQFLNIPVGTYTVMLSKSGYITKSVPGVQVLDGAVTTLNDCLTPSGPPATNTVQNATISNGQSACYDAVQTISVAGGGTTFIVQNGGIVDMIAGLRINYLPGTRVFSGGYLHGKIAPGGPYCPSPPGTFPDASLGVVESQVVPEKMNFRVYPNPTNGKFRLELSGKHQSEEIKVEIYGMRGELVLSETQRGDIPHEFSLQGKSGGIYFIKVLKGDRMFTSKLVLTR